MTEKKFIVTMEDGSIFMMRDGAWVKAFRIKYGGMEKEALRLFKEAVAKHWKARTVPTKFGFDVDWEEEYQDQASLGMDVMYVYIRAALLAVVMEEEALRGGEENQPRVLGIGEDGITEYTGHGKRKIQSEELSGRGEDSRRATKRVHKKENGRHNRLGET